MDIRALRRRASRYLKRGWLQRVSSEASLRSWTRNTKSPVDSTTRLAESSVDDGVELECPICGTIAPSFLPYGRRKRKNAQCPTCKSLERHRLSILQLRRMSPLPPGARLLHFAPEESLERYFSSQGNINYLSVDLQPGKAMQVGDMTALSFADATFDAIYCSHVLEHVPDDRKGMREMRRVLKPSGWALFMVPLRKIATTYEDWSIDSREGREKAFGQWDHVRAYGEDFAERLQSEGFAVEVVTPYEDLTESERQRYSVAPDTIFIARPRT